MTRKDALFLCVMGTYLCAWLCGYSVALKIPDLPVLFAISAVICMTLIVYYLHQLRDPKTEP